MMRRVVLAPKFRRAYRRYLRRHPEWVKSIELIIEQIQIDVFAPILKTHPLKGRLEGWLGYSCGYDCRIILSIESDKIVLLDIGTHDEVY